jgi:hypothetical protein
MAATDGTDIETLGTRIVYENRWMRVREDAIRRRDGSEGIYGVVENPDFVVIVPVEEDGRVHLADLPTPHGEREPRAVSSRIRSKISFNSSWGTGTSR